MKGWGMARGDSLDTASSSPQGPLWNSRLTEQETEVGLNPLIPKGLRGCVSASGSTQRALPR